jgi:hypothetical protein
MTSTVFGVIVGLVWLIRIESVTIPVDPARRAGSWGRRLVVASGGTSAMSSGQELVFGTLAISSRPSL